MKTYNYIYNLEEIGDFIVIGKLNEDKTLIISTTSTKPHPFYLILNNVLSVLEEKS